MITGSCACGGVRFEVDAVRSMTHCHCANCRKLTGASFATYAHVEKSKFRWRSGEDMINRYESAPGSFRAFCRICSSLVPGQAPYLETVSVPAGLLDGDPGVLPRLHVFTASKAPWWEIRDDLPQFERWVPGYEPK
ncbi:MAG: GFA family protein [Reyranellaceae bacterium]